MKRSWNPWPWVAPVVLTIVALANVLLIHLAIDGADERVDEPVEAVAP